MWYYQLKSHFHTCLSLMLHLEELQVNGTRRSFTTNCLNLGSGLRTLCKPLWTVTGSITLTQSSIFGASSCDLHPRPHLKHSGFCLQSICIKISVARCQLSVSYGSQTGLSEQRGCTPPPPPSPKGPPTICLLLFISYACILQQPAHARRPICAHRGGAREEVTC